MNPFDHQQLDELIHSRIRLSLMALLANVTYSEFTYLREAVNTTDGNLGMHLRKLEDAGYVEVEKTFVDRKPVSRYALTAEGRRAFRAYAERVETLLGSGKVEKKNNESAQAGKGDAARALTGTIGR